MKTLLQFAQATAPTVSLDVPASVVTNTERDMVEFLEIANDLGDELARRVDWGDLNATTTFTGDGSSVSFDLPADFLRLSRGAAVLRSGVPLRQMTKAEWGTLTAVEGLARFYLLEADRISLWPYPAAAAVVTAHYVKDAWCSGGSAFAADTDTVVFPDPVFELGLTVRWRRLKGLPFENLEAEFEAMLADYERFDGAVR